MKKIYKTFNYLIIYLFQMIKVNFQLQINHLNKKNYLVSLNVKKKYLFVQENLIFLKKFEKNLCLITNLIIFKTILIKKN
tara:strand:- start:56 stop:295 length:240 start_codon:yes stop_codon:yes gene_type:complete